MTSPVKRSVLIKNAHLDAGWLEFFFVNLLYQIGITQWNPRKNRLTDFEHTASKDLLQLGDIILVGQYRRLTSLFVRGVFTHALVYISGGQCIHVDGQGVREVAYTWLFEEFDTLAIVRVPNVTEAQQSGIVDFMKKHLGDPFDFWFDQKDERAWFCSELICAALKEQGIEKTMCNTEKYVPHPSGFYLSDMDVIYTSHCLVEKDGKVKLCYPVNQNS